VEIAHEVLAGANEPFYYRDLMKKVSEVRQLTDKQVDDLIARLYTDINIDGRFLCVGDNVWGLRRWYPSEKTTERSGAAKKFLRKELPEDFEDEDDVIDEEELLLDEEPPFTFGDEEETFEEEELTLEEDLEFTDEDVEEPEEEIDVDDEEEDVL